MLQDVDGNDQLEVGAEQPVTVFIPFAHDG
jgi:hypothetical protein